MTEEFNTIYNKSLDLLSRREHSKEEINQKLLIRFPSESVNIKLVIKKLSKNNILNDERFAEIYVLSRKRKGFGSKRIAFELSNKGVNESIYSKIISNESNWEEVAKKAFNKKFKTQKDADFRLQLKQKAFLQNRGFTFKEIESVFN